MNVLQVVPDDISWKQVCEGCYNYLSVPPVVINDQGQTICGRCAGLIEDGKKTKSFFNVVASGLYFKCVNHFNGCMKTLPFTEIQSHEKECFYKARKCMFCSFSGNLLQIFNHAVKTHPENISFDGIIPLPLSNHSFTKILLLPINDNLFTVRIEVTECLVKILVKLITEELPYQYAVKFYQNENQFSVYGHFSISLKNIVNKPKEELVKIFGLANIYCQILMDTFTLERNELELQNKMFELQCSKKLITNYKRVLQMKCSELLKKSDKYDFAMEALKRMSCNFFKCSKCQTVMLKGIFFCPRYHCFCKTCLSNFCDLCKCVRDFSEFSGAKQFTVKCDWPGCNVNIYIEGFWNHKTECKFRPYKCPIQDCNEIILSEEKLREHWHASSPKLLDGNNVTLTFERGEFYMIVKRDVYHLTVTFNATLIQIYVEGYNILKDVVEFRCLASRGLPAVWQSLPMSELCGGYYIDRDNYSSYYKSLHIGLA